jgi:hypothetical protein
VRGLFDLVIVLVVFWFLFYVVKAYFASKRDKRRVSQEDESDSAQLERLAQLEERIRVLERIVTDEQFDVKQRFKNL